MKDCNLPLPSIILLALRNLEQSLVNNEPLDKFASLYEPNKLTPESIDEICMAINFQDVSIIDSLQSKLTKIINDNESLSLDDAQDRQTLIHQLVTQL